MSPNPWADNSNNVRNSNPSGALDNNNANNSNGQVLDREKARYQVGTPKAAHSHREQAS